MTLPTIMVLEDEALIALDIEMTLEAEKLGRVTCCSDVDCAMQLIDDDKPDVGVLDFNLGNGDNSLGVAQRLLALGTPFIFLTGYTGKTLGLPDDLQDVPRLSKPFQERDLVAAVKAIMDDLPS